MIKHRKIIISLLLVYALFIVGIFNVRADSFVKTVNVNPANRSISISIGNTNSSFGTTFNSFNTDNANYVVIPSTLSILGQGDVSNNTGISNWYAYYQQLMIQPYMGGVPCELTSIGFKCVVNPNTTYSGSFYIFNNGYNAIPNYVDPRLVGTIDNNWQFYTSDNSQIASNTKDIATNTENINDSLNDSSIDTDNTDSSVGGFSSSTNSSMSNTPVSSMISLPITFLTGVNNALSNSCTNVNYIELFGYQLVLPCLNLSERLGSVWTIIDTIFSCMLIFSIGKSLVSTFARLSDMDTNIMYECYANGTKHRGESFDD